MQGACSQPFLASSTFGACLFFFFLTTQYFYVQSKKKKEKSLSSELNQLFSQEIIHASLLFPPPFLRS